MTHRIAVDTGLANYLWLVHCPLSGVCAAVDPSSPTPVLEVCAEHGWSLSHIFITHHHWDHTDGVAALNEATGCQVIGAAADAHRLPPLDMAVRPGETVTFGAAQATVIDVSGHTVNHVAYHFPESKLLFCGDALFSLGCGRMFEGDADMFWASLSRLRALPDETMVCCGHEYTSGNLAFALSIDPDNAALLKRAAEVRRLRDAGQATVPFRLGDDKAANPFLRADDPVLAAGLSLAATSPAHTFAVLRARKDTFRRGARRN